MVPFTKNTKTDKTTLYCSGIYRYTLRWQNWRKKKQGIIFMEARTVITSWGEDGVVNKMGMWDAFSCTAVHLKVIKIIMPIYFTFHNKKYFFFYIILN